MTRIITAVLLAGLAGCAADQFSANQICARTAGCTSGFASHGYGPIQAQAVAPDAPSAIQPQP